jgi:hypothetical protein
VAARTVQMYSGPDAVRAADALNRAIQERRDAWPYAHVYPPPSSKDVHVISTAVTQAQGAAAIAVVTYQVQSGKRFFLRGVLFGFQGGAFLPGDALFTIDRNSAVGQTNSQFLPEHGLINVPVLLGAQVNGSYVEAWMLQRAREFEPLDVVRIKATNVSLPVGAGNQYVCGLFGYEVPVLDVTK